MRKSGPACVRVSTATRWKSARLLHNSSNSLTVTTCAGLTLEHAEDTALPAAAVQVRVGVEARRKIPRVVSDMRVRSAGQNTSEARSEAWIKGKVSQ